MPSIRVRSIHVQEGFHNRAIRWFGYHGAELIEKTQSVYFSNKVITLVDLQRFASFFEGQKTAEDIAGSGGKTSYTVEFSDRLKHESSTPEVFDEEELLGSKRPLEATMMIFTAQKPSLYMSLTLAHGNKHKNHIYISCADDGKFNNAVARFNVALEKVEPQEDIWFRRHPIIFHNLTALSAGTIYWLGLDVVLALLSIVGAGKFLKELNQSGGPDWVKAIIVLFSGHRIWIFLWMMGWGFAPYIYQKIESAWPDTEFRFGSPSIRIEENTRRKMKYWATGLLLPVISAALYEFVRLAFIH